MKLHKIEQGSEEWKRLRLGIPTASQFHRIVTPTGARTSGDKRSTFMCKLICERLLGEIMDDDISELKWVKHGRQYEAQAAYTLAKEQELSLEDGGFITNRGCGCSPDRIVSGGGNRKGKGAVEIKCPAPWTHLSNLLYGPGDQYLPQVQGHMRIGEYDYIHFFSFLPQMPHSHKVFGPIPTFQKKLALELANFCMELEEETARAKDLGEYRRNGP